MSKRPTLDTFEEFLRFRARLSKRQREWLALKAHWENMTQWAVAKEWTIPETKSLNLDGSHKIHLRK